MTSQLEPTIKQIKSN